jgi:hypothetical protein
MTTTTLTDRYVEATLRRLPGRQHRDIENELRTSIADAVDDRVESGDDRDQAEIAVLTDLGDPARLAAGYADRPLHLIGPVLYLDYIRLLTVVLVTVVPSVAAAIGAVQAFQGAAVSSVVGTIVGTAFTTAIHVVFWTTMLFVVIERTPGLHWTPATSWTPAALPETPSRRARFGELIAESVLVVLVLTFVLLSPVVSPEKDAAGDPIGLLSPWLWETGVVYVLLALGLASVGGNIAKHYLRWSAPRAIVSALIAVIPAAMLIWLAADDRLLNPAFVAAAGWPAEVAQWTNTGLVVVAALTTLATAVETVGGFTTRSWSTPNLGSLIRTVTGRVGGTTRRT